MTQPPRQKKAIPRKEKERMNASLFLVPMVMKDCWVLKLMKRSKEKPAMIPFLLAMEMT